MLRGTSAGLVTTVTAEPRARASAAGPLAPGTVLGGRYCLEALVGAGATGTVYRAVDLAIDSRVALKVLHSPLAGLAHEVALARKVTHPNVCRTYDLAELDGHQVITMELLEGATLAQRLAAARIPHEAARAIALQIARGLEAAHACDIVHRDLKPHNVFVEDSTDRVVLMDFGISHDTADPTTGARGTPAYMSPEAWRGDDTIDARTDLYALGCVLHEMLAGERPFHADTAAGWERAHRDDSPPALRTAPRDLAQLAGELLNKLPRDRPRTAREVVARLARTPRPRRRALFVAVVIAAAIAVAALVVGTFTRARPEAWQARIEPRLPAYEENGDSLAISHDGKWLVYDSDRDGSWRVWLEPLDDNGEAHVARPLTAAGVVSLVPRFTHDDRAVLVQQIDRFRGTAAAAHPLMLRIPISHGEPGTPEVVATDASAADECGDLLILAFDGRPDTAARIVARTSAGTERELVKLDPIVHFGHLRCAPDGHAFAFSAGGVDRSNLVPIFLGSLAGDPPRQLTFGTSAHRVSFHPDGKSVLYSVDESGVEQIWELALAPGAKPALVVGGDEARSEPVITPDGARLVYQTDDSAIPLAEVDLASGRVTKLARPLETIYKVANACRGKLALARSRSVWSGQLRIVVLDPATREERDLGAGLTVAAEPDGDDLVIARLESDRTTRLYRIACGGGEPVLLATVHGLIGRLVVAAGVVHVRVLAASPAAWRVPLAGGELIAEGVAPLELVLPAPRGDRVLVVRGGKLALLSPGHPLDEPDPTALTFDADIATWALDGAAFYYWNGHAIIRHEVSSGEERALLQNSTMVDTMAPSPDGRGLFFSAIVGHVRRNTIVNFGDRPRP